MHSGPGRCHDEGIAEKTPSACNASAARTPPVCLTHLRISRSAIRSERRCPDKSKSRGRQAQRGEERRQQTKADARKDGTAAPQWQSLEKPRVRRYSPMFLACQSRAPTALRDSPLFAFLLYTKY